MRKMIPFLVVGILVLSGLGAVALSGNEEEQILVDEYFSFSQPLLSEKEEYTIVGLPEATSNLMQSDKPYLPVVSKVYVFPFGTDITDVDVSFGAFNEVSLEKPVMLSPEPQVVSNVLKQTAVKQNVVVQSEDSWYPTSSYSYRVGSGINDGEHVVFLVVHLYPVRCKQTENVVRYYEDATVDISYTLPAETVSFGDAYDLLILTPSQFTTQLQPLVTYKNDNGVPTTMVTLNTIPHVGADVQEDIKYYIKNAIETWGINSVILVGAGVEGEEIFPVRDAWIPSGSYEQYFPSDLYYADIYNSGGGFSDWDFDNDGKYCEYPWDLLAADLYPDVYLGRLACNSALEVTTAVNKIIEFKEHNMVINKIVQLGGDTFTDDEEHINEGEYANTKVMTKLPGYTSTKLWGSLGTLTKGNIRSNINNAVDFVDCSGHGSWGSWATHPPITEAVWLPSQTVSSPYDGFIYIDVDSFLNSKKLPVFVLNACSTSKFSESPNCLSWKVVSKSNGGGIASFGASGIGYGSYGTHETESLWGWMEVTLFEEMYNTKHLGACWANAINGYLNNFLMLEDADFKTVVEMTLLGDPTTVIENGKDPQPYSYVQINSQPFVLPGVQQSQQSLLATRLSVLRQMQGQQNQN